MYQITSLDQTCTCISNIHRLENYKKTVASLYKDNTGNENCINF